MAAKVMKSDAVRVGWRGILDDVARGEDILVERCNKPVAVVIAYEDYVALQDEFNDLRSARRAQAALVAWRKEPSLARPWEEVKAELHKADTAEGVMLAQNLTISQVAIADFCHRHHIQKLALFGSVLGSEFGADSDVDILVEFEEGYVPGFAFFDLQDELTLLLGRPVDLHTLKSLSRYFREQVVAEAVVLYQQ